ncbi:MAG: EamA family transporter [Actinobacteria bacterium]|nr:EamA family transporter [Actinomycetota bacterium]
MKHRAEFLMISAAMGFALGGVAAKVLREADMDAFRLTQIRSTGAALILLTFAFIKGRDQLRARRDELKDLILFGIIGVSAVTSFYFFAMKYLFVSVALIIEFTASIWIALYLRFVKKKHISPIMWLGIACAFSGLILVSQIWSSSSLNPIGVLVAFADAFALSYYFLTADRLSQTRSPLSLMTWGIGVAAIFWAIILPWWNFPFEYLTESYSLEGNLSGYNAPGWALILWIIIIGTVIPYLLTVTGIRELSAGTSSVIGMIEPIFAGVIAWVLLNEALSTIQLIGCAVVLLGIYLADKARATVVK